MRTFATPAELAAVRGEDCDLGVSGWHPVTDEMVAGFAGITGDHQWIHVDAGRAAGGPFGGPIAHGYLVLSMIPSMLAEVLLVRGADLMINKGMAGMRFASPVPVGRRVRAAVLVAAARARPKGFVEVELRVTVQVEGATEPALTASPIFLYRSATT